jgi:hypothetical protein
MAPQLYPQVVASAVLTINIDSSWEAIEFAMLFDSLQRLYSYYALLEDATSAITNARTEFAAGTEIKWLPTTRSLLDGFKRNANRIFQQPNNTLNLNNYKFIDYGSESHYPLQVVKIQYNSPGSIDFIGIGKVIEHFKEVLLHYIPNRKVKLENVIKEKEIEERELALLQTRIQILKDLGLSTQEILPIIGLEALQLNQISGMANRLMVTGVEVKDNSPN